MNTVRTDRPNLSGCRSRGTPPLDAAASGHLPVLLVILLLAATPAGRCAADDVRPAGEPRTDAAEISWPTPSRAPGSVTYRSKYPTETAWDPALIRFRQERGTEFEAMRQTASDDAGSRTSARVPKAAGTAEGSTPDVLRFIDIVSLPVLPVEDLEPHLERARHEMNSLAAGGFRRAVWEVAELPSEEDLAAWADACLAAFPAPPVLMLGWRIRNGDILPRHDRARALLRYCGSRVDSVMITGEQLNTQFYATPEGGHAVPFLQYWIGVLRREAPDAFIWCRIDEMVRSQRPDARPQFWAAQLLPLCDGLVYQVNHGPLDVIRGRRVSAQYTALEKTVADMRRDGSHPPGATAGAAWPLLLGGFNIVRPAVPGRPRFGLAGINRQLRDYEFWLRANHIDGYIRYVGTLPGKLVPELLALTPEVQPPAEDEEQAEDGQQRPGRRRPEAAAPQENRTNDQTQGDRKNGE